MRSSAGPWLVGEWYYSPRPEGTKDRMVTGTGEIGHWTGLEYSASLYMTSWRGNR